MKRIFLTIIVILACSSCVKLGSSRPYVGVKMFLTGECLNNTELTFWPAEDEGAEVVDRDRFRFYFNFDFSDHTQERTNSQIAIVPEYRDIPSSQLFVRRFGERSEEVKASFEEVFKDFAETYTARFHRGDFYVRTVLYNGGLSLTADKEYAGFAPGENIAPAVTCSPYLDEMVEESGENPVVTSASNTPSNAGAILDLPLDYISFMGNGVEFSIPIDGFSLVEDTVTFELNIPVRVVMYLTWLNDRLTDPDAPVPYRDEVLHCRFTSKYRLK